MYYKTNTAVAININFVNSLGVAVNTLLFNQIQINLIKGGITQNITGLYSIAFQQNGIYRLIFNPSLMTEGDIDYVVIAKDSTATALDDKIEFTLYNNSIDDVQTSLALKLDVNGNKLDQIVNYVDSLEASLANASYGLNALKTLLNQLSAQSSVETTNITSELISRTNTTNTKVDTVQATLGTVEGTLGTQIAAIPINPLLSTDPRSNKLNCLDTTSSQLPALTAASAWTYPSRYLSGTSGITQLDVNGFTGGFLVNHNVYLNVTLKDSNNTLVSGLTYPGRLNVALYKAGVLTNTTGNLTVSETVSANYRIVLNAPLIDSPSIDYLVAISDSSNVATPQRIEFTAFSVTGVTGPRTVKLYSIDSFTSLPIPDTQVYIKNSAETLIINKGITGVDGSYTTSLMDGSYKVFLRKSFVDFTTPENLIVSADTTTSYHGLSFIPSSPTSPSTCVVYGWITGIDGKVIKNAKVTTTDTFVDSYSGSYKLGKLSKTVLTDSNGYFEMELVRSSTITPPGIPYTVKMTYPGFEYTKNIIVPDTSAVSFYSL